MDFVRLLTKSYLSTSIAVPSQTSGIPPLLVAISGIPAAIASRTVNPNGSSQIDGTTIIFAILRYYGISL